MNLKPSYTCKSMEPTLPEAVATLPEAVATLPKSDSTTSLSSLISIGNESKNSGPSLPACIICLGEEGSILSTLKEQTCRCSYHYHSACLKEWFEKHSSLCPICRQQNFLYQRATPISPVFSKRQIIIFFIGFTSFCIIVIWSIVKNG